MRKTLAVVFAAVMALTLSACGGSQQAADPGSALLAAAGNTQEAKTSKVDLNINLNGVQGLPGPMDVKSTGVVDYATMKSALTSEFMGIKSEVRVIDNIAYVKTSDASGNPLTPKPWLKSDLNTLAGGADVSSFQKPSNPSDGLNLLKSASNNVVKVGEEKLRGDDVTHYRLDLDLAKAANDPASKQAAAQLAQMLGNQPLPAEAWVDDSNRVRKLTYTIDMAKTTLTVPGEPAPTGTVTIALELYDFGTAADVTAPPAEETMELTPEMKQALGAQ